MLSDDEGPTPDPPAFKWLFCLDLFKSLLYKAKATTHLGADPVTSESALGLTDPSELFFSEPAMESEEISSPKLFLDVVRENGPTQECTLP